MRNGTACILVSILLLGTVIYILGSGKGRVIENKKDKIIHIQAILKMNWCMDMAKLSIKMELYLMENDLKEKLMVKVF